MNNLRILALLGCGTIASLSAYGQGRETRLELVPPSPITDKVVIDIRGAIENHSEHNRRYTASLYLDRRAPANLLHTMSLEIGGGSNGRISFRQPTAGWAGK